MSIIWCLIWGLLTLAVMTVTITYYLPKLSSRAYKVDSEACTINSKQDEGFAEADVEKKSPLSGEVKETPGSESFIRSHLMLIGGTLFAAVCGYMVSLHSISVIGLLKMTLTFCVLACVFITDLELMLIPNLCSIVLLSGRTLIIIAEFIWMRDFAVQWLINSVVAMVISVILLLIMSKVTRGGLGLGDVKLFGSIGFLCGIRAVCFTLVLAFLLCAITSTVFLITKKKQLKDSLPLGPFIWIGYGISVLLSII